MYEIEFDKKATKQFKKLPQNAQSRIIKTLERIKIRPHFFVKSLSGLPYFRLRVGDYRLILDIKNKKLIIIVLELGNRKNIYK
jgi:mRNA interferase RelE/StbE